MHFPAYAPSRIVVPSELRSEKQCVSYPAKVRSVSQSLLFTTKVRGDDGQGMRVRITIFLGLHCTSCLLLKRHCFRLQPPVACRCPDVW